MSQKNFLNGLRPIVCGFLIFTVTSCARLGVDEDNCHADARASCFDVVSENGRVHLLFGVPAEGKAHELYWQFSSDSAGRWSAPLRIPTDHAPAGNHFRGNDPQIAARGDRLMALWTAKGGGPYGSGRIAVALSRDGGKTWNPGPSPIATDREDVGYRFPATAVDDHAFHVVWIHAEDKERSLRYARLDFDRDTWTQPTTIDSTSCACCWNELKISHDGKLFVLYRDEEPKDMNLAVSDDGGRNWQQVGHVGEFNWQFEGCPHVGGGLAVPDFPAEGGTSLFATAWTGAAAKSGAYVLKSSDDGASWSAPLALGTPGETGRHTDVAAASASKAAVVWDQQSEEDQSVWMATTWDGGKSWQPARRLSRVGVSASYPRILAHDGRLILFWSEFDGGMTARLHVERVE